MRHEGPHRVFREWVSRHMRVMAPFITLILLVIFFSITAGRFASIQNVINILGNSSLLLILGCGITMVLLIGEIDLSFAALMTLVSILTAHFLTIFGLSTWTIIPMVLILGALFGVLNGASVAYVHIPSFAVTLATMTIFVGVVVFITEGKPYYDVPGILYYIGNAYIGKIPALFIVALSIAVIFYFLLGYTIFGRYVYMVGGNREAARLAGVSVKHIQIWVFVIMGVTVAIAGMLGLGRLGSTQCGTFDTLLIDGIAAVVIGGTSLFGGEGGIVNTIIGVFIWYVLRNGLDLMDMSIYIKEMLTGIILLLALVFNLYIQKRSAEA